MKKDKKNKKIYSTKYFSELKSLYSKVPIKKKSPENKDKNDSKSLLQTGCASSG